MLIDNEEITIQDAMLTCELEIISSDRFHRACRIWGRLEDKIRDKREIKSKQYYSHKKHTTSQIKISLAWFHLGDGTQQELKAGEIWDETIARLHTLLVPHPGPNLAQKMTGGRKFI